MEQMIKTYHNHDDETINADIRKLNAEGWIVSQQEFSYQVVNEKLRSCMIVLYERSSDKNEQINKRLLPAFGAVRNKKRG